MNNEIRNGKISGTELGFTDRGPSFWVMIDYGGMGQGFGGYRLGGKFTDYVVMGILKAVGVDSWEKLKGTPVRVKGDNMGIEAIGHYLEEKWFNPKDFKEGE